MKNSEQRVKDNKNSTNKKEVFRMENNFDIVRKIGTAATVLILNVIIGMKMAVTARTKAILSDNRAEGFVDSAVKILMAVVIGALVLGGLYLLFNGTILPTLTQRIQEMFNYRG